MLLQKLIMAMTTSQAGGKVTVGFPILVGLGAAPGPLKREDVGLDVGNAP
jgi:hypothetical protein